MASSSFRMARSLSLFSAAITASPSASAEALAAAPCGAGGKGAQHIAGTSESRREMQAGASRRKGRLGKQTWQGASCGSQPGLCPHAPPAEQPMPAVAPK